MKIAIPSEDKNGLDSKVAEHFGRCSAYTFVNEEGKVVEIFDNSSRHSGGAGLPPEIMKSHGAEILLCKNLGPKAIILCQKLDIKVYIDSAETVRDIFVAWKNNKAKKALIKDGCSDHSH